MAFRPPKKRPEFADLKGMLAQSKDTDNATYQTIQILIDRLSQVQSINDEALANLKNEIKAVPTPPRTPTNGGPPTGGDEVFIGPSDPGTTFELWYDTDEPIDPLTTVTPHAPTHETGGTDPITSISAAIATSGTLNDARLSANVAMRNAANIFTQSQEISTPYPLLYFTAPDGGIDEKRWRISRFSPPSTSELRFEAIDDSGSTILNVPLLLYRNGNAQVQRRMISTGGFISGMRGAYSAAPTGLTGADAGLIYYVSAPYCHTVLWNGSVWEFAPGDPGNGFLQYRAFAPQEQGWAPCNGAVTDFLVIGSATLSVLPITAPNLTGGAFLKASTAYDGSIVAASTPVLNGTMSTAGAHSHSGSTDSQGSHSHTGSTDTQGSHAHGGATSFDGDHGHGLNTFYVEYDHGGSSMNVPNSMNGAGVHQHGITTDAQGNHTHSINTNATGAHSHGFGTDTHAGHTHALSTITVGAAEPTHMRVLVYFRR
jgi:hypothetical protein